jgi:hypothetical protein
MDLASHVGAVHPGGAVVNLALNLLIGVLMAVFVGVPTLIVRHRRRERAARGEAQPVFDEAAYADAAKTGFGDPESLRLGRLVGFWLFVIGAALMAVIGLAGLGSGADPAMKWVGLVLTAVFVLCAVLMRRALRRFAPRPGAGGVPAGLARGFRAAGAGWVVSGVLLLLIAAFLGLALAFEPSPGERAWSLMLGIPALLIGALCFGCAAQAFGFARSPRSRTPQTATTMFGVQVAVLVGALAGLSSSAGSLDDMVDDDSTMFLVLLIAVFVLAVVSTAAYLGFRAAVHALGTAPMRAG